VTGQRGARLAGLAVPVGLLAIAAALRLPNLATRGTWDADQGHDMLVLRALVRDGVVPLLGPPTSIGDVHHGALYYFLLSPAALLTGGDSPLAVAALIALAGIAAVVVTWWLARSIGGPVAGLVAGLAMAVSTSAVDESTFIWNPNLIALSSALALAGAWRAWTTGRPRWWLLAGVGTAITMQCHVLGVTLVPIVGALLVADARSRPAGPARRSVWRFGLAGLAILAVSCLPLVIHELTNDFSEIHAALDYLRSGGDPVTLGPIARSLVIGARVTSWPLAGLLTDGALAAFAATVTVIAFAVGLARFGTVGERQAARWLGLGLLWTALALTFISPSLATVVPGLPNDHYHAFADPMVFTLFGLGIGALWRAGTAETGRPGRTSLGRAVAVVGVVALLGWNLVSQPPAVHPDGGFPAAEAAAGRILSAADGRGLTLRSLPDFKSSEAVAYPLVRAGASVRMERGVGPATPTGDVLVVICDSLFETALAAPCGGPAEAVVAPPDRFGAPVDRFLAAPGRTISVYRAAP
jgi:4-amino-4-deoxy-L-arabinose transferase-like glycosyltransferase